MSSHHPTVVQSQRQMFFSLLISSVLKLADSLQQPDQNQLSAKIADTITMIKRVHPLSSVYSDAVVAPIGGLPNMLQLKQVETEKDVAQSTTEQIQPTDQTEVRVFPLHEIMSFQKPDTDDPTDNSEDVLKVTSHVSSHRLSLQRLKMIELVFQTFLYETAIFPSDEALR